MDCVISSLSIVKFLYYKAEALVSINISLLSILMYTVDSKDRLIDSRDTLIEIVWIVKDTLIDSKDTLIDSRDTLIEIVWIVKDTLIDSKDTLIDNKDTLIDNKDTLIDNKDTLIDSKIYFDRDKSLCIKTRALMCSVMNDI